LIVNILKLSKSKGGRHVVKGGEVSTCKETDGKTSEKMGRAGGGLAQGLQSIWSEASSALSIVRVPEGGGVPGSSECREEGWKKHFEAVFNVSSPVLGRDAVGKNPGIDRGRGRLLERDQHG